MTYVAEFIGHMIQEQMGFNDLHYFNPNAPYGGPDYRVTKPPTPTHYTTEGGGYYSLRPDLTRRAGPASYAVAGGALATIGVLLTAEATHRAYGHVIKDESPQTQRSMWRSFSQGLTGGFGTGSWIY